MFIPYTPWSHVTKRINVCVCGEINDSMWSPYMLICMNETNTEMTNEELYLNSSVSLILMPGDNICVFHTHAKKSLFETTTQFDMTSRY